MGVADSPGRRRATAQLLLEAVPPLIRLLRGALQAGAGPVTLTQARILARLEAGPRLVGELAAAMEVRAPTASVAVQALVRRGLARRLSDEADRRVARVALTEEGRRVLQDARRRQLDAFTRLLDDLGEDELAALAAGLCGLARVHARPDSVPDPALPAEGAEPDGGEVGGLRAGAGVTGLPGGSGSRRNRAAGPSAATAEPRPARPGGSRKEKAG